MVEGRHGHDRMQPGWELRGREEGAGEHVERHHDEPKETGKERGSLNRHGPGGEGRREREPSQQGRTYYGGETSARDGAETPGDERERRAACPEPERDEKQMPEIQLTRFDRGGERGAVGPSRPSGERNRTRRLDEGGLHHRRGQQARREECDIRDTVEVRALVPI